MAITSIYDEEQLLKELATGKQVVFEQLFHELYPRLVIFTERFTENRSEAEDIASETFTKFWLIRTQFDALNKIKSFLYITSRNAALNILRRRKNQTVVALTGQEQFDSLAETELIRAEVIGALFREIEHLPEKYKSVILLTYKEGLSSKQVAERLGITVSNVTTQRSRAIQLLKLALLQKYPSLLPLLLADLLHRVFS